MKIFKLYFKLSELDIRNFLNMALYYYRKIPLLKWLAPGSSYRMEDLKEFLSFFAPIVNLLIRFLKSAIYYVLVALVALGISHAFSLSQAQIIINYLILTSILKIDSFYYDEMKDKAIIYYELFKVDPKTFVFSGLFIQGLVNYLGKFLAILIIGSFLEIDRGILIRIGLLFYLSPIVYNAINFKLLDKEILSLKNLGGLQVLNLILIALALIGSIVFKLNLENYLSSPLYPILLGPTCLISFAVLKDINSYTEILLGYEDFYADLGKTGGKEMFEKASALKAEDLEDADSHIRKGLKGYKLLNELFFQRHRRLMLNLILLKSGLLALIGLAILGIKFYPAILLNFGFDIDPLKQFVAEEFIKKLPGLLPFVSYIVFFDENMTRTMFINCDQALMQYGFYRRPKDLLEMFSLRLRKLLVWNGLPLSVFLIWTIFMKVLYKVSASDLAIVALQMIALWVFFSVHTFFIYYIFQPYNDAYELKHPIYQIINGLVYFISYMSMNAGWYGTWVAPLFIGLALVYSIIALILVYTKAPKTFKVRISK